MPGAVRSYPPRGPESTTYPQSPASLSAAVTTHPALLPSYITLQAATGGSTARGSKACSKCGAVKPRADFWRDSKSPDGHDSVCRHCTARIRQEIGEDIRLRVHANIRRAATGPSVVAASAAGGSSSSKSGSKSSSRRDSHISLEERVGWTIPQLVQHLERQLEEVPLFKTDGTRMTLRVWG